MQGLQGLKRRKNLMNRRNFIKLGLAGAGVVALTADHGWALKYYPRPSQKRCAIVFSTWCGTSRDIAIWISEGMGGIADVFDLREKQDLKHYDHVILGGSIRFRRVSVELQSYIKEHQPWLKHKIRGLFITCGNRGEAVGDIQKEVYIDRHLARICGVTDVPGRAFSGRLTKALLDEKSLQSLRKEMGDLQDWDNLSRSDCLEFGKTILEKIISLDR